MFTPRANTKYLAALCRRLAIELASGIDVRKTWTREVDRAPWSARRHVEQIRDAIARGSTLGDAVGRTGEYFPVLFRRLIVVGDETGHLAEIFRQLADNYDHQITVRRQFISGISWPMLQLALAIGVIGFLIWIMGIIGSMTGNQVDMLGFGLVGEEGLLTYVTFLVFVGVFGFFAFQAARRGALWIAPVQLLVARVPGLGQALQTLALSKLTWTLHLTLAAGMEVRRAVSLALMSTQSAQFTRHHDTIISTISAGGEINEGMAKTRAFPPGFVDAVEVGEHSGRLVESLAIMSAQYQDQARTALAVLMKIAGFLVWMMVGGLIIFLIFRLFSFYMGALNDALKM